MKRKFSKQGNKWEDHYTRKAKKERYPARSVYKLKEIQKKNKIIKKGDRVLDLGCAPGAWLMLAAELTGESGRVVGIDLQPVSIALPPHVTTYEADIHAMGPDLTEQIGKDFNAVISDMAPKTTGQKTVDAARSVALCEAALYTAMKVLARGGHFVCKIFQGQDSRSFIDQVKSRFSGHKLFKPESTRKASREIYVIGLGKR